MASAGERRRRTSWLPADLPVLYRDQIIYSGPARRAGLAHAPMPGETSLTGAGRTAFPEPGATRQARPSGGPATPGEEAARLDVCAPIGFAPDGSPARPSLGGGPDLIMSAPGQAHKPGNLRGCRAGRERAG